MPCVRILVWPLATLSSLSVPWYLGSILKGQSLIWGILMVSRRQLMNLGVLFGKHELKTPLDRVIKCLLSTVGCGKCLRRGRCSDCQGAGSAVCSPGGLVSVSDRRLGKSPPSQRTRRRGWGVGPGARVRVGSDVCVGARVLATTY